MKRRFNTIGPCEPDRHYMIPAERRIPEAEGLVEQLGYFVVHAPRQTGKTTALLALARRLTASGKYASILLSCEEAKAADDDYVATQRTLVDQIRDRAQLMPAALRPPIVSTDVGERLLGRFLGAWARACPLPLALVFDEIDALRDKSLISVLSQLRAGFPLRPANFPAAVILCGLRDVRDYKAASGGDSNRLGTSSPFNIKLESLRLGDFTPDEVRELYAQHTADSGQAFDGAAIARVVDATAGQPWLVNAIAREIVEKMAVPPSEPITAAHVDQARDRLILARATHIDSLVARLAEARVQRVIEPILAGEYLGPGDAYDDDLQYCRDLGLAATTNPIRIANPIYREVIARVLSSEVEAQVAAEPRSFVRPDGRLDIDRLLGEFADFWRQNGEILTGRLKYHEVAPQLVLMAYLQRVVNGGGYIDREFGIGRGRIDLLVRWPYTTPDGQRAVERTAIELKVWRDKARDPLAQGLAQLDGYLAPLGLDAGVLVVFDRRAAAEDIEVRTRFEEATTPSGRRVTLLRA